MNSGGQSEATVYIDATTLPNSFAEELAKTAESAEELQTAVAIEANYDAKDLGKVNGSSAPTLENTELPNGASPTTLSARDALGGQSWVKVWRRMEIGVLVSLIVVVWGLLLVPVVIYHLPEDKDNLGSGCVPYSFTNGSTQVCRDIIAQGPCNPGFNSLNITEFLVSPRGRTQEDLEEILTIGLRVVRPSPQCEEVIVPFLCLYYLRPCDGGGEVTYRPSVEDYVAVSTEICPREWAEADDLLSSAEESLPSCEDLATDSSHQCGSIIQVLPPGDGGESTDDVMSGNDTIGSGASSAGASGTGSGNISDDSALLAASLTPSPTPTSNLENFEMCTMYTGSVCYAQLLSLQNCIPGREGSQVVYISSDVDQTATESQVMQIQGFYPILSPSTECLDVVDPFLCLYYFGLCDISGNLFEPSTETCVAISTDICQREWNTAAALLTLPSCATFGETTITCNGTGLAAKDVSMEPTTMANGSTEPGTDAGICAAYTAGQSNTSTNSTGKRSCPRECRDEFYCSDEGLCRPRCDKWKRNSKAMVNTQDVFMLFSAIIGIIGAALVLTFSCIRRKRMFTFPSVFVIYQTTTALLLAVLVLIVFMDRAKLFCSSVGLLESVDDPTPFCILSGMVFYYVLLQLAVWWFLHVSILFWKILFPFHARIFEGAGRFKYVHIVCVIVGLLAPWIPIIVVFANGGFTVTVFPPLPCTAREAGPTFYALVLPIIVLLQVGITLLIILFWTVHKKQGLFKVKQDKAPMKMGTAERKIFIIFCYYVVLGVIALSTFTESVRNGDETIEEYRKYFRCESGGIDPENPEECDRSGFEQYHILGLTAASYVLLGIFPAVNLIFAMNNRELKQVFTKRLRVFCSRFRKLRFVSSFSDHSTSSSNVTAVATVKMPPSNLS